MTTALVRSLALACLVLTWSGCEPLNGDGKHDCAEDDDCIGDRVCRDGACRPRECSADGDCADTQSCQGGTCQEVVCASDSCSGHGDCRPADHGVVCICSQEYTGPTCNSCASTYQDKDGDATCTRACSASTCTRHADCDDSSGTASCSCHTGWAAPYCDGCASGYHSEGEECVVDGVCMPTTCSGRGDCTAQQDVITCSCDPGYAGDRCEECASGYHELLDLCILDDEGCQADTCSGHGSCSDLTGEVQCQCQTGYAGVRCENCAAGYQDLDGDGICEPDDQQLDPDARWPHFGFDDQRTSCNPDEDTLGAGNVASLELKWGVSCDDDTYNVIFQVPAISASRLFVSSAGARLAAHNALTGLDLDEFDEGAAPGSRSVWTPGPVAAEDGTVYYLEDSFPTRLFALDADLDLVWEAEIGLQTGFDATIVPTVDEARERLYVIEPPMVGGGKLFAFDTRDGSVAWYLGPATHQHEFAGSYTLLLDGQIYARADDQQDASYADKIVVIDPDSQQIVDGFDRPAEVDGNFNDISNFVICGRRLLVTWCDRADVFESEGTLVAFDVDDGEVLWTRPSATRIAETACDPAEGVAYVPTDPYLYALDLGSGEQLWQHLGFAQILAPAVANGLVYYLSDTNLYALDAASGDRVFKYPLGHEADETTQPAVAGGMVFFSGNGGRCDLFALGLP